MEYRLDISNSYPRFLIFSSEQSFTTYISTPNLNIDNNKNIEILLDNIEVNFLEDIWCYPIVESNPNSIINKVINSIDVDDLSSLLTLNLKRAKISINNVKNFYMEINCNGVNYYHNQECLFNIGDKKYG